ncbi:MAG TPA: multicopper oxidase domain-containing protein [Polyangiaceae bacterium]|nr:multicopper oxidase domain-containing protein [Polyangiaceae bacterium]
MFNRFSVSSGPWCFLGCLLALGCSGQTTGARGQSGSGDSVAKNERPDSRALDQDTPVPEPLTVDKIALWENELPKPAVYVPTHKSGFDEYTVTAQIAPVQMLPKPWPATPALTYGGKAVRDGANEAEDDYKSSPGPTFEMERGTPAHVTWVNLIQGKHVLSEADASIPAEAQGKVPIVTHAHGLEVAPASDGAPAAWFTYDPAGKTYEYPNTQPTAGLWYHDHTFGMTQYNVYAGLAGMYIIRDKKDPIEFPADGDPIVLPDRAHEWPLVLQDRSFKTDGSLDFYGGNVTNVVNGKVWPHLAVDRTLYRFRLLNGSNGRRYTLALSSKSTITVIGSDGGYLPVPKTVDSVTLGPGERADVLVDFSSSKAGDFVTLNDLDASAPLDQLVRFTVLPKTPSLPAPLSQASNAFRALPDLPRDVTPDVPVKTMTLHSASESLLNGQAFHATVSEKPTLGTLEDWDLVNLTSEAHPIHLHLVQFQVQSRRPFDVDSYQAAWTAANGSELPLPHPTIAIPVLEKYYTGAQAAPMATETGWKDTVGVPAGTVIRIRVRWAPQEPEADTTVDNPFRFDPTVEPGYVWHCHILEHEDHEMMRPLLPVKPPSSSITPSGPLK